jgi:dethiobiotin synthetase
LPASPEVAAAAAGITIDFARIRQAFATLAADADLTFVEGAGGLLVPIGGGLFMADLAARLDLPVLIVARPSLGTVNHTLLTIEAARARGLRLLGFVFSRAVETNGPDEPSNPNAIVHYGKTPFLGTIPQLSDTIYDNNRIHDSLLNNILRSFHLKDANSPL